MYEVYVSTGFEAAHRLVGDFGPATRTHGHTYTMEVIVRGADLKEDGTLCDIGMLRAAADDLAATFHYRDLDEVPGLAGVNTTAEAVARYCWDELAPDLRLRIRTRHASRARLGIAASVRRAGGAASSE